MFMSTWNGNNLSEKSFHGFVSHPPWMCASCTFPWPQEWQLGSIMPLLLLLFTHLVVSSFATPGALACQAPLSIGFPRQEYWSGWPFPSPGDLPHPGIKPVSPALEGKFFTTVPRGKPFNFLPLSKFSLSANSHQPYSRHRPTHTHTHTPVWTISKNVLVAIKLWFLTWFSAAGPSVCVSKCKHSGCPSHSHQSLAS